MYQLPQPFVVANLNGGKKAISYSIHENTEKSVAKYNKRIPYLIFDLKFSATASAQRSPSMAEDTIPPEYPAPSPQG
jgi:hypothetical protein